MPIYQYECLKTGMIEELQRSIEDRDNAPAGFRRITVPVKVGYANASHLREPGADERVPKAFRELELSGVDARRIERESGFSREHIRRTWNFLAVLTCFLCLSGQAAEISKGYSFTPTDTVTSTKLNNLLDLATIHTTFFTDQTSITNPSSSDVLLVYSISATDFRKVTLGNLAINNTTLITGQDVDTTPATNDFILTYDTSAGGFKRSQLSSLFFTNDFLINGRTNWGTPNETTTFLLAFDSATGEYSKLTRSNLFYQFAKFSSYTNGLPAHTAPTNSDIFPLYSQQFGSNRYTTLAGLMTNLPAASVSTNLDVLIGFSSNGVPSKFTVAQLQSYITNTANSTTLNTTNSLTKFVSSEYTLTNGLSINTNHSLAGTPQSVRFALVCRTAEHGYALGDELIATDLRTAGEDVNAVGIVNATNVVLMIKDIANMETTDKGDGTTSRTLTAASWKAKIYAVYFP